MGSARGTRRPTRVVVPRNSAARWRTSAATRAFVACPSLHSNSPANASLTFLSDYTGQPCGDEAYHGGAQVIPGRVECAYFDLGGEGFFFQAEDGIRDHCVTGVQTCALPIYH